MKPSKDVIRLRRKLLKAIKTYDEDEFILPLGLALDIERIFEEWVRVEIKKK